MKPGKPLVYGLLDVASVIGLPEILPRRLSRLCIRAPGVVTMLGRPTQPPTVVARATE